jgi:hypothetical protein
MVRRTMADEVPGLSDSEDGSQRDVRFGQRAARFAAHHPTHLCGPALFADGDDRVGGAESAHESFETLIKSVYFFR